MRRHFAVEIKRQGSPMTRSTQVGLEPGDHVVHFYEDDEDLTDTVTAHLVPVLTSGDTALVAVVAPADPIETANAVARFPATSLAPRSARQFVAQTLQVWRRGDLVDDATLVVSELATNAVVHARSDFDVTLSRLNAGIRVTVSDSSQQAPVEMSGPRSEPGGRGLTIVGAIATRWDYDVSDRGKHVWVEFADQPSS